MSRFYGVEVSISAFNPEREQAIIEAANGLWPFEEFEPLEGDDGVITGRAKDYLYAGEGTDEFAERFAKAIWETNDGCCRVEMEMAYLEAEPPTEDFTFDEDDYVRLMNEEKGK